MDPDKAIQALQNIGRGFLARKSAEALRRLHTNFRKVSTLMALNPQQMRDHLQREVDNTPAAAPSHAPAPAASGVPTMSVTASVSISEQRLL